MRRIINEKLPFTPWMEEKTRKLPGIQPVKDGEWLMRDEMFVAQMAYRDALLAEKRPLVYQAIPASLPAQTELLDIVDAGLDAGYRRAQGAIVRPDGERISMSDKPPIITAARLVQEDLLILEDNGHEFVLTAAILCFPARWTLSEKFGRGLMDIHAVVPDYDGNMGMRVQRMFDHIRPEQPVWRANFLRYANPDLHQPRLENASEDVPVQPAPFVRVERQSLRKLARTGAVVFTIRTYISTVASLSHDEQQALEVLKPA